MPVLAQIRRERPNAEIICLFPNIKTAQDMAQTKSSLYDFAQEYFDGYIWPVKQDIWQKTEKLRDLETDVRKFCNTQAKVERVTKSKTAKKYVLVRKTLELLEHALYLAKTGKKRATPDGLHDLGAVMTDVLVLRTRNSKKVVDLLYWYRHLKNIPHFFLNHGIYVIRGVQAYKREGWYEFHPWDRKWFINHESEQRICQDVYGFRLDQLQEVGVPRHDESWMQTVIEREKLNADWTKSGYALLISRPAGEAVLPKERKRRYLEWVKNVVCEENSMELVIKMHPKEEDEGDFEGIFGIGNKERTWCLAGNHPFVLASGANIVLTFWSGVCVDMIRLKRPTIEVNDVNGLDYFDNADAFRDGEGRALTEYAYYELVLQSRNEDELRAQVEKCLNDRDGVLDDLNEAYGRRFFRGREVSRAMAKEIVEEVGN